MRISRHGHWPVVGQHELVGWPNQLGSCLPDGCLLDLRSVCTPSGAGFPCCPSTRLSINSEESLGRPWISPITDANRAGWGCIGPLHQAHRQPDSAGRGTFPPLLTSGRDALRMTQIHTGTSGHTRGCGPTLLPGVALKNGSLPVGAPLLRSPWPKGSRHTSRAVPTIPLTPHYSPGTGQETDCSKIIWLGS